MKLTQPLQELGDLLLPVRCTGCGIPLLHSRENDQGYPVCAACAGLLKSELIRGHRCLRCGRPLTSENGQCVACRSRRHDCGSVLPLGLYEGILARLLRAYKLEQHKRLAGFFAELLHPALAAAATDELLVRVPSSAASIRRRGWDHTQLIEKHLQRRFGCQFLPLLSRRPGRAQKELDYEARARNMLGSIEVRSCGSLSGARILCVDDILTTGATLNACAAALLESGASQVRAVVIAADP